MTTYPVEPPPAAATTAPGARPRASWRAVALPTEHGGWGLAFEPVLLGLIVKPSGSGFALGAAAMLAFLARTPLKLVLVDRWRHRWLPRTRRAAIVAAVELAVVVGLLAMAAATASAASFWVPLLLAVPFVAVQLWFDMRSRSRRLVPELAGSIGIAAVGAAIVLAGGGAASVAAGAWLVIAARAVASLPYVRFQLQRARRRPARRWAEDLAQLAAVAMVLAGVGLGWLPWRAGVPVFGLAAVQLTLARLAPPSKATVVGLQQLFLGVAVAITAGLALA
jgi:hypothetical protein